jgi:lincosamide nucleotidyltransferase A/C/D/E
VRSVRQGAVRAARAAYLAVERSPLAPLLSTGLVRRVKARITFMPAAQVLAVLDLVAEAGVPAWVAGGWGVDALAGRQTRRHYDLDLVIGDADEDYRKVAAALSGAGFRHTMHKEIPGLPMPVIQLWQHDDGYSVEVLPVALADPPFGAHDATGTIGGRRVLCLSAQTQLALHSGYELRDVDHADIDLLRGDRA